MLSPVLIFGAGMHHQVLSDPDIDSLGLHREAEVLRSWSSLLQEVATRCGVPRAFDQCLCREMPTLQWERLVQAYCDSGDKSLRSFESESKLRSILASVVREAEQAVEPAIDFGKILELREVLGRHAVSLNIDTLLSRERPGRLTSSADAKSHFAASHSAGTIWFPHGAVSRQSKITFGLRDYGRLPHGWGTVFKQFKQWERQRARPTLERWNRGYFDDVRQEVSELPVGSSASFVAHLMLAPVIFFGASVSREEWGIWWLLTQRARNLARAPEHFRPPTAIIIESCNERLPFWSTRPANVSPIVVRDWNEGWVRLIDWLGTREE